MQAKSIVPQTIHGVSRISLASSRLYNRLPTIESVLCFKNGGFSCSFAAKPEKRGFSRLKVNAAAADEVDHPKWWEKNVGPNMIDVHSTLEFLEALSQAGDRLVIVEFFGSWCASCRTLGADGLLDSFSCSLAKLSKLKDAIAIHNKAIHNGSPMEYSGGASNFPELSASREKKPL
ncbi:hypothetical protein OROGR_028894 [Orobanche gracilis]